MGSISLATWRKRSFLLPNVRKMVTSFTSALSAMDLVVVPSKPFSAKSAKAAANILSFALSISSGRISFVTVINIASNYLHTYMYA